MGVSKNEWGRSVISPYIQDPTYSYFEVDASSYLEDFDPYNAFQHEPNDMGWLCEVEEGFESWISLSLGYNFKNSYTPTKDLVECFAVTKVEVYNQHHRNWVCKQFAFQGYDGLNWNDIRVCKILKDDPSPIVVTELPAPGEGFLDCIFQRGSNYYNCVQNANGTYSWVQRTGKNAKPRNISVFEIGLDGYRKYRLVVQVPVGKEKVGFGCINMYTLLDHDEITYSSVTYKGRTFPRLWEKIYVNNDECQDLVWEKIHDKNMIYAVTSWYPGYYSSTSFAPTMTHPYDDIEVEETNKDGEKQRMTYSGGPYVGTLSDKIYYEAMCQTKDYLVGRTGAYYYSPKTAITYTHNGIDWTKKVGNLPDGFWLGGGGGWCEYDPDNKGIAIGRPGGYESGPSYIWRLDLDGSTVKTTKLGEVGKDNIVSGSVIGNIITQGTYLGPKNLKYYRFIDANGQVYDSPLQYEYEWTDMSETDPAKQVKKADCSWTFCQAGNNYYAAAKHRYLYYYNEVKKEWQSLYRFVVLSSGDGFQSYGVEMEIDPCPDYRFRDWGFGRIGDGAVIIEKWAEVEDGKITNKTHTTIGGQDTPDYVDIPLIGVNSDRKYHTVRVAFSSGVTNGGDTGIRVDNFGVSRNFGVGFISNGAPTRPTHWVLPTAFKANGWSSGSYDCGGFIIIDGGLMSGYAYTTDNYMIDRHNYTYENIRS